METKDLYKQLEKGNKIEILVENKFGEVITHIEYRNGYAKAKQHKDFIVKFWQKKEGKRKERLL